VGRVSSPTPGEFLAAPADLRPYSEGPGHVRPGQQP
jgi:hypothetical protein